MEGQSSILLKQLVTGAQTEVVKASINSRQRGRAATMIDVARLAGVSTMTVSRYINGRAGICETARPSVAAAIALLDFTPNMAARTLSMAGHMNIGILHSSIATGFLGELLVGANEQALRASVPLLIECCEFGRPQLEGVETLIRRGVSGVILPPPLCDIPEIRAAFKDARIAAVLLASGDPSADNASIGIDQRGAAREMTNHLIELGHRRIGFVTGDLNHTSNALRLQGYREAVKLRDAETDDRLVECDLSDFRSALDATDRLLDISKPPTAIFASNCEIAAAAISTAYARGLDVPRDISVVSFEDGPLAITIWPELTTVYQPYAKMASRAVELLTRMTLDSAGPTARQTHRESLDFFLNRRRSDAVPRLLL